MLDGLRFSKVNSANNSVMEEDNTSIDTHEDRSAKTAEILRALKEQAEQALLSHLHTIEETEAELSRRIQNLSEELSRDEHESQTQAASLQEQLNDRQELLKNSEEELVALQQELESLKQDRNSLSEELEQVLTERLKETEEKAGLQEELSRLEALAQQTTEERDQLSTEMQELAAELESSSGECQKLTEQLEESQELRDESNRECERLQAKIDELSTGQQELEAQRNELEGQLQKMRGEFSEMEHARDQLSAELQSAQDTGGQLNSECDDLTSQLEESRGNYAGVEADLAALQKEHAETHAALEIARNELKQAQDSLGVRQQEHEELQHSLDSAQQTHQQQLEQLQQQIDESERKCELALADVHKLKKTNAELHEELASRPESDDGDSPDLVHLRAERDELATRVQELESAPPQTTDDDQQQKLADLQARFEMAVEDVRSLKQENESLKSQLAAGVDSAPSASDTGELDWQAQKARLLQELDEEDGGSLTPERSEQRATIKGTIAITDKVVQEKDREIEQLRQQLQEQPAGSESYSEEQIQQLREQAVRDAQEHILSEDEVIQTERARLAELQEEWKDKLRTAELEISVQRAEIAREKAKLDEKLSFLESQKEETPSGDKPRRRWLSALGIKDEEDQEE